MTTPAPNPPNSDPPGHDHPASARPGYDQSAANLLASSLPASSTPASEPQALEPGGLPPLSGRPPQPLARLLIPLLPLLFIWLGTAGLLLWLLYSRTHWNEWGDEADIREWIENTRIFRKTLAELAREYLDLTLSSPGDNGDHPRRTVKRSEIIEHIQAMVEPIRLHGGQLPQFPDIARLEVRFDGPAANRYDLAPIGWVSPKRPSAPQARALWRTLRLPVATPHTDVFPVIHVEYRLHTYDRAQLQQDENRWWQSVAAAVLIVSTVPAAVYLVYFLLRERNRERERWQAIAVAEHRERELLRAEFAREQAERKAMELRTQIYVSIGILAGSYAHNIKNLLVRPNDLLHRCLQDAALPPHQQHLLREIQHTLATVTERLQQILRTVRRDPSAASLAPLELVALLRDTYHIWHETAQDKWKVDLHLDLPPSPLWVRADHSHLQQAVENLLFNARDAAFEMRNHLRQQARQEPDPHRRRTRLLEAAAWRGQITLRAAADDASVVLELVDNGIGMTEDIRQRCLQTYFSTKRDNALYEGYSAGMGLGLSFVAMVMEHHGGAIEIVSAPLQGSTFRLRLPRLAAPAEPTTAPATASPPTA